MTTDPEYRQDSRSRVVSFRISGAEYESAMALCRIHGYRGISGFARSAFLSFRPKADQTFQQAEHLNSSAEIAHQQLRSMLVELNQLISTLSALQSGLPQGKSES